MRQKAAAMRQERQPVAGSPAAACTPETAATALGAAETSEAAESVEDSAAAAPETLATTAFVPVPPTTYVVGDIVKLGANVAKAVQGAEAQVIKVLPKTCR